MGNSNSNSSRGRRRSSSIDSISNWYTPYPPRKRSSLRSPVVKVNQTKNSNVIKRKRSNIKLGYYRIPVFIAPHRGAEKMLGNFECDVKQDATIKELRSLIAKKMGCPSSEVSMDGFGGQPFDPSLDAILQLQELPGVIIRRIVAFQNCDKKTTSSTPKRPPPPKLLTCPLTKKLFEDPWITIYGNTYEKKVLLNWGIV